MKINENEQLLLGIRGGVGGVPPPSNCWQNLLLGIRGGTPPDQLLADAAVGVRGGGTPSQSGVRGGMKFCKMFQLVNLKSAKYSANFNENFKF